MTLLAASSLFGVASNQISKKDTISHRDLKFRLEKKENIPMNSIVVASCYFIASAVGCIFGLQFSHLMQEHVPGSLSRDPIN
uniref:Uncharacterized protein n=1 Tax=Daphnia galeata TaxID=27404 RepID=A0A8J2WU83_9CRUS|nr:unnamed protein product [Daphnia galeata]